MRRLGDIRCRGFTAVEALLAAAILAILTAAVSGALMAGRAQTQFARDTVYSSMLAHALMDEVMRLPVTDPQGYTNLGPDPGEVRATFNSVKDYSGFVDGPNTVADIAGNIYPSIYQPFVRTVSVQPTTYSPTGWGSTVPAMIVTVTVTRDGVPLVTLQRVCCN